MALARVQTTPKATAAATSVSMTFTTPPTVGNGVVVEVIIRNDINGVSLPTTGCTDNRGNTYTRAAVRGEGTTNGLAVYYCPVVGTSGSPFTVTITGFGGSTWFAVAHEVSGVGSGLVVDRTVTNGGGSTTPSTGTTAALTSAEVFLVALHDNITAQASITVESVSPAWTEDFEQLSGSITGEGDSRVRTGVAGTTQSCAWTFTSSTSWNAMLVAFAAPAAPAGAASASLSQLALETLSLPTPAGRVTQAAIETLSRPVPPGRLTQLAVETLSANVAPITTTGVVTQLVVETLGATTAPAATARATQLAIETLSQVPPLDTRLTQLAVEAFVATAAATRTTQLALEVFTPIFVPARLTQQAVEWFQGRSADVRVSQQLVEVFLTQPPCTAGDFPIDLVDPGGSCATERVSAPEVEPPGGTCSAGLLP